MKNVSSDMLKAHLEFSLKQLPPTEDRSGKLLWVPPVAERFSLKASRQEMMGSIPIAFITLIVCSFP